MDVDWQPLFAARKDDLLSIGQPQFSSLLSNLRETPSLPVNPQGLFVMPDQVKSQCEWTEARGLLLLKTET